MTETAHRARALGNYIVTNAATVRAAAKAFGISKSTVHTDVTEKLRQEDADLWKAVRAVLDLNKSQRHIRGGLATKEKYRLAKAARNREKSRTGQKDRKE